MGEIDLHTSCNKKHLSALEVIVYSQGSTLVDGSSGAAVTDKCMAENWPVTASTNNRVSHYMHFMLNQYLKSLRVSSMAHTITS